VIHPRIPLHTEIGKMFGKVLPIFLCLVVKYIYPIHHGEG